MKKIYLLIFTLSVGYSNLVSAQNVPPALDNMLRHTLDSMKMAIGIKSLSAAIQLNDTDSWTYATGISSVSVNVTAADAYLMGSVAKTVTAACILKLAEDGLLDLDDSLHQWIDTFQNVNPDITIRQLLRHQSGLFDVFANPDCNPALMADMDSVWSAKNLITNFVSAPLAAPGGAWNYCNTNYMLLGMIIEKVTGNPFYQELRSRFFTPLGMNTIAIPAFEPLTSPVAHVWLDITGDGVLDDANNFYMDFKSLNSAAGACGGYFTTAKDVSKWMRSYMRGDLLSAAMMTEAKTTINAPGSQVNLYGLGLMKNNIGGFLAYGHGGDLAYSASSWYFPEKDISISVLGNDAGKTSWALIPVVEALLKTYHQWQNTTGISPIALEGANIKVYPSPFESNLKVELQYEGLQKNFKATLINISGQTIATTDSKTIVQHKTVLTFSDLAAMSHGIYFVKVYADGNFVKTVKVLK